jgi:uncharacterized membrane protein HdeD (DUF308 family)
MLRVLLTVLLPLAAPFLIYLAWLWLVRRRAATGVLTVNWREAPWPWLLTLGLVCSLAGLAYLYLSTGHPAGTELAPPSVVDGVVVPSHPVE